MHSCKVSPRLLARLAPLIGRPRRALSAPAVASENASNAPQVPPEEFSVPPAVRESEGQMPESDYPPILDLSLPARKRRNREEWHTKIQQLGTVEEKIFELNMPKYYGWKVYSVEEGSIPYDPLPYAQYVTRTHVVDVPSLPAHYDGLLSPEALDASVQLIKDQVEEALVLEYNCRKWDNQCNSDQLEDKSFMENLVAKAVCKQVNRILTTNLSPNYIHLLESQIDVDPRIEAFWFFGGFEAPYEVIKSRAGRTWTKEYKDDPVNQCIWYTGSPILQLRHNLPLKEIISLEDSEDSSLEIPVEHLDPRKQGYFPTRKRATIVPGFWPGDFGEFGIISYHNRGYLIRRPEEFNDNLDAIKTQAVLGSFSWLYGQACYQGFSTFQDPTYPLVNQMVITNGQWWSFSVYQLNATTMHIDRINENNRKNVCWITEPIKLFESIEDGKVQGLNEDVLKHLIKFYANAPEVKEGVEMKPYLSSEKVIAGIEEAEKRIWLEEKYKYLASNRKRHRLIPEVYHWQKIYMIQHNTRFIDKKRDPWQFGINVYQRRLDDHTPKYIPKCYREHPKSKDKWAKNHYPSVRNVDTKS